MSEWKEKTLDELGKVSRGKSRHRPRNAEFLYGGPYPFIQTGDIENANFYINSYSQTYSEQGLAQSKLWPKGTLCLSIVGANTGASAILRFDACFPDSVICFTPEYEKSDVKFVKYALELMRVELKSISQGAARENLSLEKLLSVKFKVPSFYTQKRIACILSTYDDLIENNLKRIKLLEEIAQRTYEEWFVKFRINGVQLEVGENGLPEGWERKLFSDIIDFKEGPGLRNTQYRENGIPFLNIRVIKDDEVDLTKIQYLDSNEVNEKYQHFLLQENDHVISTSGTLGRVATIRKSHLPICLNTSIIRMRPINESFGIWLIKHTIKNPKFKELMESYANGSAQVNFGPIHLKQIKLNTPPKKIAIE